MRRGVVALWMAACGYQHGQIGAGTVDSSIDDDASGSSDDAVLTTIPLDCLDARDHGVTTDGPLMIDPDGADTGAAPFTVYCDMTTDGGGWTLVYVYGFADFQNFDAGTNAATPRPDWPLTTPESTLVPISTQTPTSPQTPGAMPFAKWSALGPTFLATSNINHWLRCSGTGRIVTAGANGAVTCSIVQVVASACTTVVPTQFTWFDRGPTLLLNATGYPHYYYWEASTAGSWPTHDPCGANGKNHVLGVTNPRGAIWLRR